MVYIFSGGGFSYGPPKFKPPGNPFAHTKPPGNSSSGMIKMMQIDYNMINNYRFLDMKRNHNEFSLSLF